MREGMRERGGGGRGGGREGGREGETQLSMEETLSKW